MNKRTLIVLVTVLVVVAVLGTCIGLVGYSFWKDIRLQQGEMVTNPDKLEITYAGVYYESSAHFEEGECYLVLNVTNRHDFSWARVSVHVNYTDNGKEKELWVSYTTLTLMKPKLWLLGGDLLIRNLKSVLMSYIENGK
jgi:hypothetical protein